MINTVTTLISLECIHCGVCNIPFAIESTHLKKLRDTGIGFYCPNGHGISYSTSENSKLKKELDNLNARLQQRDTRINNLNDSLNNAENRVRAMKAVRTKLKKRMSEGKCPCCSKTFADLKDHMKAIHPEYK